MLSELEKELKKEKDNLSPIYLVGGDNPYLIEKFVEGMVRKIVPEEKRSFNWVKIDEDEENALEKLQTSIRTVSMLGGEKVVQFRPRRLFRGKDSNREERFLNILNQIPRGTYLILTAGEDIDKRTRVFKQSKKKVRFLESHSLKGRNLHAWINQQVKKRGKVIDREALFFLEHAFYNKLYVIENELEKVFLFMGDQKKITRPLLEEIISTDRVLHDKFIFEWLDAISKQEVHRALEMLGEMLSQGTKPVYIFTMLARQVRLLALCWELKKKGFSQQEAIKKLGEKPYPVQLGYRFAGKFSFAELFFLWQEVFQVSERIVRGQMEWQPSLEMFLFRWKDYNKRKTRS